jgi:hypothetical protein
MTTEERIIQSIEEEAERIQYGAILIEVKVREGKLVNAQIETRRSVELEKR